MSFRTKPRGTRQKPKPGLPQAMANYQPNQPAKKNQASRPKGKSANN